MADMTNEEEATTEPTPECELIPGAYNCPACGHMAVPDGPPGKEILHCTECKTMIAYGVALPRVIVQPDEKDLRFLLLTFETMIGGQKTTATYKVVRAFGKAIGQNILSICP
jgi:hypothetical protein